MRLFILFFLFFSSTHAQELHFENLLNEKRSVKIKLVGNKVHLTTHNVSETIPYNNCALSTFAQIGERLKWRKNSMHCPLSRLMWKTQFQRGGLEYMRTLCADDTFLVNEFVGMFNKCRKTP